HKLSDEELNQYQGVLGHYHIQTNKTDPGPAFQWDYVIENARHFLPPTLQRASPSSKKSGPSKKLKRQN
ncbi:MAG: hypothetical protein ACR2H1_07260, partial [Limisphaerales bacterium]